MDAENLCRLLTKLDGLSVCVGHPDQHFVKMVNIRKGKIVSSNGKVAAYVDEKTYSKTVRTADCDIISQSERYSSCKAYRVNLRAIYCRWSKRRGCDSSDTSSHTNDRYLRTPKLKSKCVTCERECILMKKN